MGTSDAKLDQSLQDILLLAGHEGKYEIKRTQIGNGEQDWLQSLHFQTSGKPKLLLMHGFGGSGALFFKLVAELLEWFDVTAVDWLGMGCSGRPDYSPQIYDTPEKAIDYFVESLNTWIEKTEFRSESDYVLAGHSMGGYLSVHFALKHPEKISKLILISPVGFPIMPEGFKEKKLGMQTGFKKFKETAKASLWDKHWSPITVFRITG